MGSEQQRFSSQEPSTTQKNFAWPQMSVVLGLLMTWYLGTD
jgi:hypothetical protein